MTHETPRSGFSKFRVAVGGVLWAFQTQVSFRVQCLAAIAVVALAVGLGVSRLEGCLLALCIAIVLSAEAFNTSLEHLARAITREQNEEIRRALDVAAGAVLVASIGAGLVGVVLFVNRLLERLA